MPKQLILMACVVILGSLFAQLARADTNIDNCTFLNTTGETYLLTADIINSNTIDNCLNINNNSIILDCQNHIVNSDGSGSVIEGITNWDTVNNITVRNCNVSGWVDAGIYFNLATNITIYNSISNNNTFGIYLTSTDNVTIYNNTINDNGPEYGHVGIMIYTDANNNRIYNNTINNSYDGIYLSTTTNEIFYNTISVVENEDSPIYSSAEGNNIYNNFLSTIYLPLYEDYLNYWNTTRQAGTRIYLAGTEIGGNYWTNSTTNGYSDTCTDANTDGFCDIPYDVGNNTGCVNDCGPNTDYLPLSPLYECQPSWNCTDWSECVRGYQTRDCVDDNQCENETGHPAEIQECFNGLPNATFNISDSCCPISQYYCTDNETLVQLWNTSEGVSWAVAECNYGCDNATSSCAPAPYEANLWTLAVIIGIIIAIAALYRWSRR